VTGIAGLKSGTLNVKLAHDYHVDPDHVVRAELVNDVHGLHLQRCRVRGRRCVIVRNDFGAPRPGWRNNPLHVVEIMSDQHLRHELHLEDDSVIDIEVGGGATWWDRGPFRE
jgi:CTP-dependent riboflavin kinase